MVITTAMSFQIKFHQIRAFVEVARQGSIRGASRTLALSQPALTKAIKELEEGLSAQLFVRRSQGVSLTENGESFYQHASLILEELRAAQEDLLQRQGALTGQINIGLGASVARSLMPSVICRFHQQHPLVKVRIMEGQLLSMINELRQGSSTSPSIPIIPALTIMNSALRSCSKSRLRSSPAPGIPQPRRPRLNNCCITAGPCRPARQLL
jgi:LysR family transcriptional regulator of abg operon